MDIDWVRQQFPVFQKQTEQQLAPTAKKQMIFMDNAGGSQTVRHAMDAIVKGTTDGVKLLINMESSRLNGFDLRLIGPFLLPNEIG